MRTRSHSKCTGSYWRDKIYKAPGRPNYQAQIQYMQRRHTFVLGLSDSDLAAKKAGIIYTSLMTEGWDATLAKFAPGFAGKQHKSVTVGEFIAAAESVSSVGARTWADYKRSFRRIVADLEGIDDEKTVTVERKSGKKRRRIREVRRKRFDYRTGGHDAWIAQVDKVQLETITPTRIEQWMKAYVESKGMGDPAAERSARNSANSLVRQARGLFSREILRRIESKFDLPEKLPFAGVRRFPRQSTRYLSQFNAIDLLQKGQAELLPTSQEAFKILLLALAAGLRRKEIDNLLWRQIDFENAQLTIEATPYFKPKSEDSVGVVDLDPEVAALLKELNQDPAELFVIHSTREAKPHVSYSYVRAKAAFDDLYEWLRSQGISDLKPAHVLRKEFGSLVCERHGLYEASRALRHADIQTTAQHYLDKKGRRTVGLGGALKVE